MIINLWVENVSNLTMDERLITNLHLSPQGEPTDGAPYGYLTLASIPLRESLEQQPEIQEMEAFQER
jgi:hypothetical protein